jgi:hypothetical protein
MAAKPKATTAVATVGRAKLNLPAHLQGGSDDVAAFQSRLAAPTGNKIRISQDKKFNAPPSDAFPAGAKTDFIHGIIVDFIAKKTWYEGAFNSDNIVPPNCFALEFVAHDQLSPSENSPEVQCEDSCAKCPQNQWVPVAPGSQKKKKACKDSYILAILPPDAVEGTPLLTLELSATAVKFFDKYVRDLAQNYGLAPYAFVTEFGFDDKQTYASVRCNNPEPVSKALYELAKSRREEAATMLQVEPQTGEFEEKVVAARLPAPTSRKAAGKATAPRR